MPRYTVTVDGHEFDITLERTDEQFTVEVDGHKRQITSHTLGDSRRLLMIDKESFEVDVRNGHNGDDKSVFINNMEIPVTVEDYALSQMRKQAGVKAGPGSESIFVAPMPGLVVEARVAEGQQVKPGDPLIVIEAMKMENILKAKGPGKVKAILVKGGQSVEKGDRLVEFE